MTTNLPAGLAETFEHVFAVLSAGVIPGGKILSSIHRLGTVFRRLRCQIGVMATVTQNVASLR